MLIRRCNLGDPSELHAVHALQRAAYAVESALIGTRNIPGLRETPEQLAASPETFWGLFVPPTHMCAGVIATEPEPDPQHSTRALLRISRLAVDPTFFRRGVAKRLLEHVIAASPGTMLKVTTGAANAPGRRLYESAGFRLTNAYHAPDGTEIVEYRFA